MDLQEAVALNLIWMAFKGVFSLMHDTQDLLHGKWSFEFSTQTRTGHLVLNVSTKMHDCTYISRKCRLEEA